MGARHDDTRLRNGLALAIRRELAAYYAAPIECDEPSCREQARAVSVHVAHDEAGMPLFPACTVPRCKGRMLKSYPERRLHVQLLYFKRLFDAEGARKRLAADAKRRSGASASSSSFALPGDDLELLNSLMGQTDAALAASAYNNVDFGALFAQMG